MELPVIGISASPRSLGRLKKGHKVRLCGGNLPLAVNPDRHKMLSKVFLKGKGAHFFLTPEEIHHNQARGIFGKWGDDAMKWVGEQTGIGGDRLKDALYAGGDMAKGYVKQGIDKAVEYAPELATGALSAAAIALGQPELLPAAAAAGQYLGKYAGEFAGKHAKQYLDDPSSYGVGERGSKSKAASPAMNLSNPMKAPPSRHPAVNMLNEYTGNNVGYLDRANAGTALANLGLSQLEELVAQKRGQLGKPHFDYGGGKSLSQYADAVPATGSGLYGHGLYGHGMGSGAMNTRRERCSVGLRGNLLGHGLTPPPALTSQAMSSNFQWGHTLPPAFQGGRSSTGSGLYP